MLTLLGINKVMAVYVGPGGYAAIGQFQNAMQMITTIVSGSISTGVTKLTAEHCDNDAIQQRTWKTAGSLALIFSLVVCIAVTAFNESLAAWFLRDVNLGSVFIWFAVTLVFFVSNNFLLAILNGKKDLRRYIVANITGSLLSLITTTILTANFGLYGTLVALTTYQSLAFIATLKICLNTPWFKINHLIGSIDPKVAKNLGHFTIMALTSAICFPVTNILIRNLLGERLGWNEAGYWEAMSRVSTAYLLFATSTLSVYFLPRLAELKNPTDIRREILQSYKLILPTAALTGIIIYLLRETVIEILFTKEFYGMEKLFAWQMVGDTLKIGSWVMAYLMLGKSMVKAFVYTEILSSIIYYLLVMACIEAMQLKGAAFAYAINYLFYWVIVAFFVRKHISN